jgi:hypothetical protein
MEEPDEVASLNPSQRPDYCGSPVASFIEVLPTNSISSPPIVNPNAEVATLKLESLNIEVEAERLQAVLAKRQEYHHLHNLPLDHFMKDGAERMGFLNWVRSAYDKESLQLDLQRKDKLEVGPQKVKAGCRARWHRELQRRCGTKQLWEVISFSGRLDPVWLESSLCKAAEDTKPVLHGVDHRQLAEAKDAPRQKRQRCGRGVRRSSRKLYENANKLIVQAGSGRLHAPDGSSLDIGGCDARSQTRRVLDDYRPVSNRQINEFLATTGQRR